MKLESKRFKYTLEDENHFQYIDFVSDGSFVVGESKTNTFTAQICVHPECVETFIQLLNDPKAWEF